MARSSEEQEKRRPASTAAKRKRSEEVAVGLKFQKVGGWSAMLGCVCRGKMMTQNVMVHLLSSGLGRSHLKRWSESNGRKLML